MYDTANLFVALPAKHKSSLAIHRPRRLPHISLQGMADRSIAHSAVQRLANSGAGGSGVASRATGQAETGLGQFAETDRRLVRAFRYS